MDRMRILIVTVSLLGRFDHPHNHGTTLLYYNGLQLFSHDGQRLESRINKTIAHIRTINENGLA
jgi:hypothetical protein